MKCSHIYDEYNLCFECGKKRPGAPYGNQHNTHTGETKMNERPYTMDIERVDGTVEQHGFHLGTDLKVAESFVIEALQNEFIPAASVALRKAGKLVRIYDYRDLEDEL